MPTVRMAWWTRPPPSRVWAMTKAWPSPPEQVVGGHPHLVVVDEGVHALVARPRPSSPMLRTISTPGVSVGTRNIDIPR